MVYGAMGRLLRAIKLYLVPSILSNDHWVFYVYFNQASLAWIKIYKCLVGGVLLRFNRVCFDESENQVKVC